ncbi:MAG: hypothetical protein HUJ98_05300, partial [Bacteroidaceae bacterium]|nr:hypothetical protein [Bacteroidaceae bacterium]
MMTKLKSEADRAAVYGKKLRHDKADLTLTKAEVKKAKQLKKQGRKKIYSEVATSALSEAGKNLISNEDENVGTESLSFGIQVGWELGEAAATAIRKGKANENPYSRKLKNNPMKKEFEEAAYKKSRKKVAGKFGDFSKKLADGTEEVAEKLVEFVARHSKGIIMLVMLFLLFVAMAGALSSCTAAFTGLEHIAIGTSYTADDDVIVAVDEDYKDLEEDIKKQIKRIPTDYPGYDEYNYYLDEVGHNPYLLAGILTVVYEDYSRAEVQSYLQTILAKQYKLKIEEVVEIRTRTETKTGYRWVSDGMVDGEPTGHYEPYEYEEEV